MATYLCGYLTFEIHKQRSPCSPPLLFPFYTQSLISITAFQVISLA